MAYQFQGLDVPQDVLDALDRHELVEAIKRWRAYTGEFLKEAKDFCEALRAYRNGDPKAAKPESPRELPKQDRLIKLMGMTQSTNDGEALVALRMASKLLADSGWTWERLIQGRITIVEDPFAKISTPDRGVYANESGPPKPSAPRPTPRPTPAAPNPRPKPSPYTKPRAPDPLDQDVDDIIAAKKAAGSPLAQTPIGPLSSRQNRYAGFCYCCGDKVKAFGGFIFDPQLHNPRVSQSNWEVICDPCNTKPTKPIALFRAPRNSSPKTSSSAAWASVTPDLDGL